MVQSKIGEHVVHEVQVASELARVHASECELPVCAFDARCGREGDADELFINQSLGERVVDDSRNAFRVVREERSFGQGESTFSMGFPKE